jgi:hypothetical protein
MSRDTTGAGGFTSRGDSFRLWAGIVFVAVVTGLLDYVLPSPAQWRQSISTFVANLPAFKGEPAQEPAQASTQDDNIVWMSIGPETPVEQTPGAPVALTMSGLKNSYSLGETVRLEIRNNEGSGAAWYTCQVEQRSPEGWRQVAARLDNLPSSCSLRISPLPAGQALNIAWSPAGEATKGEGSTPIRPGEYRFAVRAHRGENALSESSTELHSQPFVLK